jgi:replicative DNA helicase
MAENTDYTFSAYLGVDFQQRLMWQLLVEPEFAEKTIPDLAIEYFDEPNIKRLFIIILEYFKEYEKVPNLQNKSIHQAINEFKTPNNLIEEESLFAVIKRIELWNERIINKQMLYDGDAVRKSTMSFIKQQEYRKLSENIQEKVKNGDIKSKYTLDNIEERFHKIARIGEEHDDCESVGEGIKKALRKEFRETIPTGIETIDVLTGGGLGKGEIGVVLTPSGVGKALPNSHKVLTPNGWVENGMLKVDDYVFGSDGKSQKILGVYPQGERKIYKITFSDQTTSYCDLEHLWAVNSFKQRNQKTNVGGKTLSIPDHTFQILKTSEMLEDFELKQGLNYRLPNVQPVQFNKTEVKIDPYVMGILLGDGCLTRKNQPHIITSDLFIVNKIRGIEKNIVVHEYDGRKDNYKKLYRISLLNSRTILDSELGLYGTDSSTKFIPDVYLYNCVEYREKLLQGLIDSDGSVGKNNAITYSTVSKKLSKNVRELVLSLGGTCRINEKFKKYTNSDNIKVYGKLNYVLTISFPNNGIIPCSLPAKIERVVIRDKYEYNKFIKNIEYSHEENATCIYVENDDHLYVIDDYVLTHNTTFLTKIANTAYEQGKNVAQIIFEDTTDQIKRKHYVIWGESSLTRINEEDEADRVFEIAVKKTELLDKTGKLMVKRFSQEDTTIKDVKNWMISYEKKFGYKFDILVLDYLDCLESHKKTPDRNEAELAIVKGFEALASELDIPAWTAIQSNRSGFGAEFVEAHQSGGSIKRIQKAHFFMSIAKTPAQQEANFANIRIIKARFAKDGQAFEDCVFNNDTLQIIIDDPRYRYSKNYKGLKHYDETDIEKLEKKAEGMSKVHVAVSQHTEGEILGKINNESINDLLRENRKPEEIKPNIDFHPEKDFHENQTKFDDIKNIHINTSRTDLSTEELKSIVNFARETINEGVNTSNLLEIDETIDIETLDDVVSDGVNDVVSDGVLLDWSGETFTYATNEPEVNLEDIPPIVKEKSIDLTQSKAPKVFVQEPPPTKFEGNDDEILRKIQEINLDKPQGENKGVFEMLKKKHSYQHVIKKE